MKKALTIICIVVMIATLGLSLFACNKDDNFGDSSLRDFEPYELQMGLKKPTQKPVKTITDKSTPEEVLDAINQNFLNADFVATFLRGNVNTTVLGGMKVEQTVVGDKMRHGKASDADVEFWADNKSKSMAAAVYDETYMKGDTNIYRTAAKAGDVKYSGSKDKKNNENKLAYIIPTYTEKDGTVIAQKEKNLLPPALDYWTGTKLQAKESFDSKDALVTRTVNNPMRIWMYDTELKGSVAESTKLTRINDDMYKISMNFNIDIVTKNYYDVLEYMLVAGAGEVEGLNFLGLRFDIVLWDNGYIADLYIQEMYSMKVAGIIKADVTLNSRQQYSYDEADKTNNYYVKNLEGRRQDAIKGWPSNTLA